MRQLLALAVLAALAGCSLESIEVVAPEPFMPETHREGDRLVMPLTFPDATTAELAYPAELRLERFRVRPYSSARLADVAARDFFVAEGLVSRVLERINDDAAPALLAEYEDAGGRKVGLWNVGARMNVNYLGFQFGRWAVLVYDYKAAGWPMTDEERAAWVRSFSGRETDDGWLILDGASPLRLARAGAHAGPSLGFAAQSPSRSLELVPGQCRPHREQDRVVAGKRVQWEGGFADWCVSEKMRAHAGGDRAFVGALIRGLAVRGVELGPG